MNTIQELAAQRVIARRKRYAKRTAAPTVPKYPTHYHLDCVKLRTLRKETGMTQCRLAELSGIANSRISDYERRSVYVHRNTMNALAAALGVDVDDIIKRGDDDE